MALHRTHPAALRHDDRNRLALNHRFQRNFPRGGGFFHQSPALAEQRLRAITITQGRQIFLQPRALALWAFQQLHKPFALGEQLIALALDFHFFQAAQAAQTHVENGFCLAIRQVEFGHHHGLGLILSADDFNHAIKIEIGNQIAFKQFNAIINF